MKIIVMMKQVASKDAILRINKESTWIEEADLSFEVNESDGYALEEGLRLKEKHGGEVVVCSMGPQRVKSVIKDALARGADRAIHVVLDDPSHLSPYSAASILAEAVRAEQPDLILTGLQSDDNGYAQTGVIMAELLGLPHATIVIEVDASGEKLARQARTRERLVPVVLDVHAGAAHDSIRHQPDSLCFFEGHHGRQEERDQGSDARAAEIIGRPSHQRIEKIYLPEKTKQTQFLGDGNAKAGAVALAEKLHTEARII